MSNPFDSDEYRDWANHLRKNLIPQMRDAEHVLMLAPRFDAGFDIDFAVQIGATILLEKPLIVLADKNRTVPPKLLAIADKVIPVDLDNVEIDGPEVRKQIEQAMIDLGKQ